MINSDVGRITAVENHLKVEVRVVYKTIKLSFLSSSLLSSPLLSSLFQPLGVFSIRCHPARDKVSQTNTQAGPLRRSLPHAQVL